jgi:RNA polymerase sigma factor (TIGR02999 family)
MRSSQEDATALLAAVATGDDGAKNRLFAVVYGELHGIARASMRKEGPGNILQTTALVHEAYLNLVPNSDVRFKDRKHFFRIAARAMRRILAGEARKRKAVKRGSGRKPLSLDLLDHPPGPVGTGISFEEVEMLDRSLDRLGSLKDHGRLCTIVELRFFVGLTLEQTAEATEVSVATVKRDWRFAKAWLHDDLKEKKNNPAERRNDAF